MVIQKRAFLLHNTVLKALCNKFIAIRNEIAYWVECI